MKPSWEWTEYELLSMKAAQTQESLYLDFKSSASLAKDERKKDDISKDVSALANSEGGDILYGVSETGTPPSSFGDIDIGINASDITPEWVEQVINSRIQPRISGIKITPIELKKTHPGKYAYAVYVPPSYNAPHQASDKRYYKRFNFHSVPMEDYEIRDLSNRKRKPELFIDGEVMKARNRSVFDWRTWLGYVNGSAEKNAVIIPSFNLRIWLENKGAVAAKHAQIILSFDNLSIEKVSGLAIRIDDIRSKPSLQCMMADLIFPKHRIKIMDIRLRVLDLKELCCISSEVTAEDFNVSVHDYRFHNSYLFMAQVQDTDGKKLRISLNSLENMFKK